MRINIETLPLNRIEWFNKYNYLHFWINKKGIIQGKFSIGIIIFFIHITFTKDAYWSGISFSLNLWETKK